MKLFRTLLLCLTCSVWLRSQPVPLGTSGNFAVLAGSTVTNTGSTVVSGNVGVYAGTAVTGFPPGIVTGGVIHAGDAVANLAQFDLSTAYFNALGRSSNGTLPGDIGGTVILPGVYTTASSLGITGTVTLNGNGNSNAVFIFQIGSALTTAATNSNVSLINGAQASNVFWQVGSSATLGTSTIFNGTILAQASITLNTSAVLNGRALARVGAVTLAGNSIVNPGAAGSPTSLTLSCPFPNGQVGQPYASALLAIGGLPPYAFSISAGNLPTNLILNNGSGGISGSPTVQNVFSFTGQVQDSALNTATAACSITIAAAAAPTPTPVTPAPSSLILVVGSLAIVALYVSRQRLLKIL
jgi:Ice-binding-like/Putative Ig domain